MTARYICFEGTEGVGKTTQTQKLVDHLRSKGFKVLQTKEPGTPLAPLTMELRNVMLNAAYDKELTPVARELISQAIRSIHLENLVAPSLDTCDFVVQDRGILSGFAYGDACGNDIEWLENLACDVVERAGLGTPGLLYDDVIYLTGDATKGLSKAKQAKQEFEAGDAIEAKGASFMETVAIKMNEYSKLFPTHKISVDGKNIEEVFDEIISVLGLREEHNVR